MPTPSTERQRRTQPMTPEQDNLQRRERGEIEVWPQQTLEISGDPDKRTTWTVLIGGRLEQGEVIIFDPNISREYDISSIIGEVRKGNTKIGYQMTAQEVLKIKERAERRAAAKAAPAPKEVKPAVVGKAATNERGIIDDARSGRIRTYQEDENLPGPTITPMRRSA